MKIEDNTGAGSAQDRTAQFIKALAQANVALTAAAMPKQLPFEIQSQLDSLLYDFGENVRHLLHDCGLHDCNIECTPLPASEATTKANQLSDRLYDTLLQIRWALCGFASDSASLKYAQEHGLITTQQVTHD